LDHRKDQQEIYKIGCSNDFNRRINEYAIDIERTSVCDIKNEMKFQHELIGKVISKIELQNYIGKEDFESNERINIQSLMIIVQVPFTIEMGRLIWMITGR
jgi:hypothetical protein